ncbi:MAG: N-acyl homoserine lactonase family protein [Acidobacteriales bacterium]|nr:N-acyl homoserine lactonase family protein [Terriglobales bacterium]
MEKSIAAALWILLTLACFAQAPKPAFSPYEVFAIRYGTVPAFSLSKAHPDSKAGTALMVWLIRGNGRNILVDAGYYHERFLGVFKTSELVRPTERLRLLSLEPGDITDLIVTHFHFDHIDGIDLFPKARVWIQKDELAYHATQAWQKGGHKFGVDPEHVIELVRLNTQGRVALIDGDAREIMPGIKCYTGGKHTYASQNVTVETAKGTVVLAGDDAYLDEYIIEGTPNLVTLDPASNLRAIERMRKLAASPKFILPGHEPAVMQRFPTISPGIVKVQ